MEREPRDPGMKGFRYLDVARSRGLIAVVLAAAALAFYLPVLRCDFVRYDDPTYVTGNLLVQRGISLPALSGAFASTVGGFWMPVTQWSHALDVTLHGMRPAGHHLTSLLLHAANAVLLFLVLSSMTGSTWRSGLVAALFALHPINVESVAWIAERKNLLCALFWLLALAGYVGYVRRPGVGRYVATLLLFALSLMSKPMAVTFPFALLLLDWWPLNRAPDLGAWKRLAWEKTPFFLLSLVTAGVAMLTQRAVGAMPSTGPHPVVAGWAHAVANYARYLDKAVWPDRLAVLYPRLPVAVPPSCSLILAFLLLFTAAVGQNARRVPYLLVGWLWFLGTLVPVIGLVPVGYHDLADRFAYLPFIGLFVMLAWGAAELVAARPRSKAAVVCVALAVLAALGVATSRQLRHWRNSRALFEQALRCTRGNFIMHDNLGSELVAEGRLEEAMVHYAEAVRIRPDYLDARMNLAIALLKLGRSAEALQCLEETVRLFPASGGIRCDYGIALAQVGRTPEAVAQLAEAVRLDPGLGRARLALGGLLLQAGRPAEAAPHLREAVRLMPESAAARRLLGEAENASPKP